MEFIIRREELCVTEQRVEIPIEEPDEIDSDFINRVYQLFFEDYNYKEINKPELIEILETQYTDVLDTNNNLLIEAG